MISEAQLPKEKLLEEIDNLSAIMDILLRTMLIINKKCQSC